MISFMIMDIPPRQESDEERLTRLMDAHGSAILRICYLYLKDHALAQDAAQTTFVKAWQALSTLREGSTEKAWLVRIAVNTCKDTLRSSWLRRIDRRKPIEELPLYLHDGREDSLALTQAVSSLPAKLKDIVLLYYYQDMNLRACAQALGISAATATRRLQQAQKKLRNELERG